MIYLVDGHNLIPKIPGMSLRNLDDEQDLLDKLQGFCQGQRCSLEVFFDGAPVGHAGDRRVGSVRAIFVRQGKTADQAIIQRLRQLGSGARNAIVVTSDRRVQVEARALFAQIITSDEFAVTLNQSQPKNRNLSEKSEKPQIKLRRGGRMAAGI